AGPVLPGVLQLLRAAVQVLIDLVAVDVDIHVPMPVGCLASLNRVPVEVPADAAKRKQSECEQGQQVSHGSLSSTRCESHYDENSSAATLPLTGSANSVQGKLAGTSQVSSKWCETCTGGQGGQTGLDSGPPGMFSSLQLTKGLHLFELPNP